jgi:hypothetical protein
MEKQREVYRNKEIERDRQTERETERRTRERDKKTKRQKPYEKITLIVRLGYTSGINF